MAWLMAVLKAFQWAVWMAEKRAEKMVASRVARTVE